MLEAFVADDGHVSNSKDKQEEGSHAGVVEEVSVGIGVEPLELTTVVLTLCWGGGSAK